MPAGNSSERWDPIECRRERERNRGGRAAARGFTQHNTQAWCDRSGARDGARGSCKRHLCGSTLARAVGVCAAIRSHQRGGGVLNNLASPRGAKRRWPKHHFRSARVRLPPTISKPWPPAHWRRCTGVELARMGYHASSHLFPPLTGGAHSPRARLTACADARDFPRPTSMGILSAKSYLLTTAHERSRLSRCRRTTLNQLSLY